MIAIRQSPFTEDKIGQLVNLERRGQYFPWNREMFQSCRGDNYTLVEVISDAKTIGYCLLLKLVDEYEVINICVCPSVRGRGIGYELLSYCIGLITRDEGSKIFLEVRESNSVAISLYKKLGFKITGKRKNYYKNGDNIRENGTLMTLIIGGHNL